MLTYLLLSSLVLAQDSEGLGGDEEGEVAARSSAVEGVDAAQDGAGPEGDPPAAALPTEEELHRLEAASFYKIGLELVSDGRFDEAEIVFESIRTTYSDTDLLPRVSAQLEALALLKADKPRVDDAALQEAARQAAVAYEEEGWAELAINQGLAMPGIVGVLLPGGTFQPGEPAVPVTMAMAGLGLGVGGAYLLDRHYDMDRGHAMAIFTGEWAGLMNGYLASAIAKPRDYRGHWRYMLGGTLVGGTAGAAAGHYLDLSSGDMALINTGGLWGGVVGLTSLYYLEANDDAASYIRFAGAVNAGMAIAAGLTRRWSPSRKQMAVINMSAVAGAALGVGTAFMGVEYGSWNYESYPAVVLTSGVIGAAVGGYLTGRNGQSDSALAALWERGQRRWSLGVPLPTVIRGTSGTQGVGVSFANGRF
ncbi:MAG: hypothetical protein VXW32_14640 [Myxococcota bacterium]|nr:hypothetical protein [Myxococcota bacterium]